MSGLNRKLSRRKLSRGEQAKTLQEIHAYLDLLADRLGRVENALTLLGQTVNTITNYIQVRDPNVHVAQVTETMKELLKEVNQDEVHDIPTEHTA